MWKVFIAMLARAFAAGAGAYACGAPFGAGAAATTGWPPHTPAPLPRRVEGARVATLTTPHALA